MRKKIIIGVILLMIVIALGIFAYFNVSVETEYTPEQEIEDTEYRNTAVSLYFENIETGELQAESRVIDSKELLKNPYSTLINMLIEGAESTTLQTCIPEGTELISAVLDGSCLNVNLSNEFIQNASDTAGGKMNSIYSIVNTVTELNEVNSVKILIDGEENSGFEDDGISFENEFVKYEA